MDFIGSSDPYFIAKLDNEITYKYVRKYSSISI